MTSIKEAVVAILHGKVVAFPTETVYGLGANALDAKAVRKIFELKGRPHDNPVIVHIADLSQLSPLVESVPDQAKKLIDAFWPGPLTIIFKKSQRVPAATTSHLDTIAIRMPSNKLAQELIRRAGVPIAAPSANKSTRPSPTTAQHVKDDFGDAVPIIDGGPCEHGLESTVIDVTTSPPTLLRPGSITQEQIEGAIGSILAGGNENAPRSPGMKYRHYAPTTQLILAKDIGKELEAHKGKKIGVIKTSEPPFGAYLEIFVGNSSKEYARNLFAALRHLDAQNLDLIIAQEISEEGEGRAIMNRLKKAANK
jgi:L-threonylcarbamoyladenylate synthase